MSSEVTQWTSASGWLALGCIAISASVPIVFRLRNGRRMRPDASAARLHVVLGLSTAGAAFAHTLLSVLALGSPEAVSAGVLAFSLGGAAFCLLLAHTGLGLQLRNAKLRRRPSVRATHLATAIAISVTALLHAGLLVFAVP